MLTKKDSSQTSAKSKTTQSSQSSETDIFSLVKAPNQQPAKIYSNSSKKECSDRCSHQTNSKAQSKTSITVKYDVGFNNQLYIRGQGANLNWNQGQPLKNIKADEWIWETETPFSNCEFKVLINDHQYETGYNHTIQSGSSISYTPTFS
jgi:hypothetical protein